MRTASAALAGVAAVFAVFGDAPANACSIIYSRADFTPPGRHVRARHAIDRAYAVIDGEVVHASTADGEPALVYAHRALRGPQQQWFRVAAPNGSDCNIGAGGVGTRRRMILMGRASGSESPILFSYDNDENARYEDRILESDRRRDFPTYWVPDGE